MMWAAVVFAAVAVGVTSGIWLTSRHAGSTPVTRSSIVLPAGQVLTGGPPAISRDGRFIAYTARRSDGITRLYIRALDRFEASEIPESQSARLPFFSPNADRVGFFARGKLFTAPREGGTPVAIADSSYIPFGGTWGDDDAIYYAPALSSGILRVPASGGKTQIITEPDDAAKGYAHVWPKYLFDTHSVLFSIWGGENMGGSATALLSPSKGTVIPVSPTIRSAIYAASGHLLASQTHNVVAAPFDPARPHEARPSISVVEDVYSSPNVNTSWFAVSDTGTLVYVPGDPSLSTMAWVDRSGNVTPFGKPESMADPSISPDGARVVMEVDLDLWIRDLRRGTSIRLTFDNQGVGQLPVWSHDGSRIIFASNRSGDWDLYSVSASGGPATRLLARRGAQFPVSVAPDGTVMFNERSRATGNGADLWTLSPAGLAAPFNVSPTSKVDGQFSPDGSLVAYTSDETGRNEVYLRPVANPAGTIAVSSEGGSEPRWAPGGNELFYRRGDAFFAVKVNSRGALAVGETQKMFETLAAYGRYSNRAGYAVSPDGKRFLILRPEPRAIATQINLVLNWFDELRAKAPTR
jgi:serine/threonine-protein kinase